MRDEFGGNRHVITSSIFISSVQKELAEERRAVKAFVEGDPLLRRYFTAFLFEDLPASDRRADEIYLEVIRLVRRSGRISNTEYQDAFAVSKPTATRDLEVLQRREVLVKVGRTGKGTHYVLNPKGLTKGSKGSSNPKG